MNFNRDYRFFLKVALVFLIFSMLLPFAFSTYITTHYYDLSIGPQSSRLWGFYWSFIYLRVSAPLSPDLPSDGDPGIFCLVWLTVPQYWDWRSPIGLIPLRAMFVLQIVLLLFGFTILKKTGGMRSLMLLLIGIVSLAVLYWLTIRIFSWLSFGFWLLVPATLFISIALARAKNWI